MSKKNTQIFNISPHLKGLYLGAVCPTPKSIKMSKVQKMWLISASGHQRTNASAWAFLYDFFSFLVPIHDTLNLFISNLRFTKSKRYATCCFSDTSLLNFISCFGKLRLPYWIFRLLRGNLPVRINEYLPSYRPPTGRGIAPISL